MGIFFSFLAKWIGGGFASALKIVSDAGFQWFAKSQDARLEGFKAAAGLDERAYEAWLNYETAQAALTATARSWWGPKLLLMVVATPACLHVAMVFLDSTFRLGCPHYGCLAIPDVPERWASTENMVLSFLFGVSVVGPFASSVAAWLHRRRA